MPIQISVDGYRVSPCSVTLGTAGSVDVAVLEFSFSDEWAELEKRITFRACGHAHAVACIIPTDGILSVPPQAMILLKDR